MFALQELLLNNNFLTFIHPALGNCAEMRYLNLSVNRLTTLHPTLSNFRLIERLCLAENRFTSLPPVVCTMTSLTDLRLERNELTSLTPLVGNLVNLRTFDIANNVCPSPPQSNCIRSFAPKPLPQALSALPRTLGNMANLRELRANDNQISALPPSIREVVKLEKVRLFDFVGFLSFSRLMCSVLIIVAAVAFKQRHQKPA
jgi:Leucine-rich repeat (LRR) protein